MNRSFSIIIVTWNGLNLLKKYLPSVLATDYPDFEIIIADNASNDGTAEWIQRNHPECNMVNLNKNYGYAGGNNRAAKTASGNVIIFLNNDAKPEPDWLYHLNESFNNMDAAIIQPKIKSIESPHDFEYAGAAGGYIDWLGYPFCRGRLFDHIETDYGQYDEPVKIFWSSGAAFAVRKELFQSLNGFDERFQFHMEEIDLCWRALRKGFSVYFNPKSVVYHLGGGSMSENSPLKTFYNFRNSLLMLTKNLQHSLILKILLRLLLDGITGLRFLLQFRPDHTLAIIRAHFSYYKMLPDILKTRKFLQDEPDTQVPDSLIYNRLIVIDYFLRRKKVFHELEGFNPSERSTTHHE